MIKYPTLESLYRRATMEMAEGNLRTWSYLANIESIAEGEDTEAKAFFVYGDTQGYTPNIGYDN